MIISSIHLRSRQIEGLQYSVVSAVLYCSALPVVGQLVLQLVQRFYHSFVLLFNPVKLFFEVLVELVIAVDLGNDLDPVLGAEIVVGDEVFGLLHLDDLPQLELLD